ncbi:hypothetical protein V8G54_034198 [Vigna mungo]|uniref:Uncharacterized protein n=1 Tax=Vigna mungo TaxID=3915 RepID=A0AAQ3RKH8_VIGMU
MFCFTCITVASFASSRFSRVTCGLPKSFKPRCRHKSNTSNVLPQVQESTEAVEIKSSASHPPVLFRLYVNVCHQTPCKHQYTEKSDFSLYDGSHIKWSFIASYNGMNGISYFTRITHRIKK